MSLKFDNCKFGIHIKLKANKMITVQSSLYHLGYVKYFQTELDKLHKKIKHNKV